MKRKPASLHLNRETVRDLNSTDLRNVGGGVAVTVLLTVYGNVCTIGKDLTVFVSQQVC